MEEWGIGEIEETLKAFTFKAEDVEQIQASLETEITDLSVLDTESMEILVVDPSKSMTQIKDQVRLAKKEIKEILALTVKRAVSSTICPRTQNTRIVRIK
jgi:hypothetical protein